MRSLGIEVRTHLPSGSDGRRVTARAKGKVERPFRKIKEMHETLYHFHEPEDEANAWLLNFLARYNAGEHRHESHSKMDDWLQTLPASGVRAMCGWDRFCTFAREPEASQGWAGRAGVVQRDTVGSCDLCSRAATPSGTSG